MGTQMGGVRPSRRQLLQGTAGLVLAGAVRPATSDAAPVPTDLRPDVVHRGRAIAVTADGRRLVVARANRPSLVITDRRRGGSRTVTLAGHPLELAIRPDRRAVAVTTAFWEHPGLELVRLADGARLVHLDDVGAAPFAPAFTHDGGHLVLTGGEQDGSVRILEGPDLAHGRALGVGRVPRGVAITPDDRFAWVALQAEDALVRVDLRRAAVTRRLAVPALPDRVALSPDGRTLLVAHGGRGAHTISEVDLHRGRVRERPVGGAASGVAWGSAGRRLAAVRDAGAVVSIDRAGHRRRTATVGAPRGLAVAGRHAFTVSAVTGEVGRVRA
jgi:DNA-binding beta-propeller fold protein YncE